jgi:ATP-dependent exoDNAse (exonuclease V) alpha subunit
MQLTDDQKAAHAAFTAFMVSPDKEMVISGPAGVGKSTLLKFLMADQDHIKIQQLLGENVITNWNLSATTNKAAEVLQGSTGEEAKTVHSLLGIQVRPDFKTGRQLLSRKANATILTNALLVVDECSMIDRRLDQLIDESTMNCKILYVGDHCQMAPVMEDLSPVFQRNTPVELKQVVRSQHTPDITALCMQLREQVETGVFTPIQAVPGVIDYLDPDESMAEIKRFFVDDPEGLGLTARILAYRNEQVHGFNSWIREQRGMPPNLTVGEWAISNAATMFIYGNGRLRIEQEVHLVDIGEVEDFRITGSTTTPARRVTLHNGEVWVAEDRPHVEALLKHYSSQKDWVSFYRLKDSMADLRPRDACTVYKAQGSTYHTVFVDLKDIGRCTNPNQAARMLYVACSRPTHRICFIGDLPARFRGG